jgi:hypothetical protein
VSRGRTSAKQRAVNARTERFFDCLADGYSPKKAAKEAGISLRLAYARQKEDPEFAAQWAEAYASGTNALEDKARDRAMIDSDTLMMFLLKSRDPARYREPKDVGSGHISVSLNFVRNPAGFAEPQSVTITQLTQEALLDRETRSVRKLTSVGGDIMSDLSEAAQGIRPDIDPTEQERKSVAEAQREIEEHNAAVRNRSKK